MSTTPTINKEFLEEFKKSIAEDLSKTEKSLSLLLAAMPAACGPDGDKSSEGAVTKDHLNQVCAAFADSMKYCHARIDNCMDKIYAAMDTHYNHAGVGHLPKMSCSQMNKVLKTCGLAEDFNVVPDKTIYASVSNPSSKKGILEV